VLQAGKFEQEAIILKAGIVSEKEIMINGEPGYIN
jgi:hypothetical protein